MTIYYKRKSSPQARTEFSANIRMSFLSDIAGKCRKMSETVGKCRELSEIVGNCPKFDDFVEVACGGGPTGGVE